MPRQRRGDTPVRILVQYLETASVRPVEDSKERATSCLENLLPNLAYNHVLSSVVDGFFDVFFEQNQSLAKLLENSLGNFRTAWKTFEAVLVEQLLLDHLFEKGYGRERGACANVSFV